MHYADTPISLITRHFCSPPAAFQELLYFTASLVLDADFACTLGLLVALRFCWVIRPFTAPFHSPTILALINGDHGAV